jgi:hypothetical protein
MGEPFGRRGRQRDLVEQAGGDLPAARGGTDTVYPQRFDDRLFDGVARVERGVGILENGLDPAAEREELASPQ